MNDLNRPVANIHGNAIMMWKILPQSLRNTFIQEFSNAKISNPQHRITELEWKNILIGIRDNLIRCPKCGDEAFVGHPCLGRHCKTVPDAPTVYLKGDGRKIPLVKRSSITFGDKGIDGLVVANPKDQTMLLLQNITSESWDVNTPSGKIIEIAPRGFVPIKPNLRITIKNGNQNKTFQII